MKLFGLQIGASARDKGLLDSASARQASRAHHRVGAQRSMSLIHAGNQSDLNYSWTRTPVPINTRIAEKLQVVRARARDVAMNTDHGAKFVRLVRANVIGPSGIMLQSKALDRSGALDNETARAIEAAWIDWGTEDFCSMCGELSWVDLQQQYVTTMAEDGEVFVLMVPGRAAGKYGFALHVVDAELCPVSFTEKGPGSAAIRMGVERNAWGRPVAYYFHKEPLADLYGYPVTPGGRGRYERVPAAQVIHGYLKERPGQIRGLPWMVPSLVRLKMLAAYDEAALINARIGASKVGVITTPDGEFGPQTNDSDALDEQDRTGEQVVDVPDPGSWFRLAQGESLTGWNPEYPRGEYGEFTKAILHGISSGLGCAYSSLSNDLEGTSYASGRTGLIEERDSWKVLQTHVVSRLCRRVYGEWLLPAVALGHVRVNGRPVTVDRLDALLPHRWQPRRWPWVDPKADLEANKIGIDESLYSRSEIIRETGRDPYDVWEEILEEQKGPLAAIRAAAVPAAANEVVP